MIEHHDVIVVMLFEIYLAVETEKNKHEEENGGPERGGRHLRHRLWVGNEGQTRTCNGSAVSHKLSVQKDAKDSSLFWI